LNNQNENDIYFRKPITITAERLSDHSRITFTISSNKTIEYLRSLLNHHLPPRLPNQFSLYSFQRGALIHFHPPSFKLDYFPVIFDQSVLLLQMDDRIVNDINRHNEKNVYNQTKKQQCSLLSKLLSLKTTTNNIKTQSSLLSSPKITCSSILKQIFRERSRSDSIYVEHQPDILTY
jgi:hypothetical protein